MGKKVYPKPRGLAVVLAFVSQGTHLWVLQSQLAAVMVPGILFFLIAVGQGLFGASLLLGGGRGRTPFVGSPARPASMRRHILSRPT